MIQRITHVENGPPAGGPYSFGVIGEGKFLYVSGQGPWNPEINAFERGTVARQTELTLENVRKIIVAAGAKIENIVSCRVFLQQLTERNFQEMNSVYAEFFGKHQPARTTIGCQLLNIDVEIDAVVLLDS